VHLAICDVYTKALVPNLARFPNFLPLSEEWEGHPDCDLFNGASIRSFNANGTLPRTPWIPMKPATHVAFPLAME
jgi:hypothetical protein